MAALIQRDAPVTGQYVAIGAGSGSGGLRAVFYYSNKSVAGGYGIGVQWGLSQTPPLAANDPGAHLVVIVSVGSAAGTAQDSTTKGYVDGASDFIVLSGALSDAGRRTLEGRLALDANRADLLPTGHPYRDAAPRGDRRGAQPFRGEPLMIAFGVLADRIRANGHRVSTEVS